MKVIIHDTYEDACHLLCEVWHRGSRVMPLFWNWYIHIEKVCVSNFFNSFQIIFNFVHIYKKKNSCTVHTSHTYFFVLYPPKRQNNQLVGGRHAVEVDSFTSFIVLVCIAVIPVYMRVLLSLNDSLFTTFLCLCSNCLKAGIP